MKRVSNMTKLTPYLFLALFGVAIANPLLPSNELKLDARIVGGFTAKKGQFPYQVSLQRPGLSHFCGASILKKNWILTAAHCVPIINNKTVAVIGTTDISKANNMKYIIDKVIPHRYFNVNGSAANDIALIKTKSKMKFSRSVQPIRLPESNLDIANLTLVYSGWGRLSPGGPIPSKLQYLQTSVFDHASCVKVMKKIPKFPPVNENQFCTFRKSGQGLCNGDSGGPIVTDGVQVGVVSMGVQPCATGHPDVSTHVWKYLDWIHKTMNEN